VFESGEGLSGHPTISGWTKIPLSGIGREDEFARIKGRMVKARVLEIEKDHKALGSSRKLQPDHGLV